MGRYAPIIDETGIRGDDFSTTLAKVTADAQSIFGADVVLSNDTQDGQMLGVFALGISDCIGGAIAAFNSFSPGKAQGAGLASLVKLNGLKKKIPSSSLVTVTIGGTALTPIQNGVVSDPLFSWALPALVTIPNSGTIDVVAVCTSLGAVTTGIGTVTKINTPVLGWQTVTNADVPTTGTPVEVDGALRVRQSASVALPSITIFEGMLASIAAVAGVTRLRGYENATNSTDGNGIPSKNLAFFVEGGVPDDIFDALVVKKTPGIPTVGALTKTIVRPSGSTILLKFARPTVATIAVVVTLKALQGFSAGISEPKITAAVTTFINAWRIGGDDDGKLSWSEVLVAARIIGQDGYTTFKIVSIAMTKNTVATSPATNTDVVLAYNESAVAGAVTYTLA